jgi:tetratricopeptide (TPR) repeat protein
LRKGAGLNSSYGPVWQHLGLAYQKKGQRREALQAFEKATRLMPTNRSSWARLAEEYRAAGRGPEATRAAARAQSLPNAVMRVGL